MAKKGPNGAGRESLTDLTLAARTAENLSDADKMFRDRFVVEYIKDMSPRAALYRMGYTGSLAAAAQRANTLMREPYVAHLIHDTICKLKPEDIVTRQQVMAQMWKEANDPCNPGKVRVAAIAHVATMLGMSRPKEEVGVQPVGVLLIPMVVGDDWGLLAAASQQALKSGAAVIDGAIEVGP